MYGVTESFDSCSLLLRDGARFWPDGLLVGVFSQRNVSTKGWAIFQRLTWCLRYVFGSESLRLAERDYVQIST
jgi:hypothetical protein